MDRLSCHVLIIGAGAAGLRAAIESARGGADTLLVCKGPAGRSGATFYRSSPVRGMQVSLTPEEAREHVRESLEAGLGMADANLVEILVGESAARYRDLLTWGVRFRAERAAGCFGAGARAFVIEDLPAFGAAMLGEARRLGVRVMERTMVAHLTDDLAALAFTQDSAIQIDASAVVIAAGGGAGAFRHSLTAPDQTGDAIALAAPLGAGHRNLEFLQFVPGNVRTSEFVMPHTLTTHPTRARRFPFSTRDSGMDVDLGLVRAGGEVQPMAHAQNGGLAVDDRSETAVPGLFACGEAAGGMHGADRIGGNMFTATQVFGARAGRFAAQVRERKPGPLIDSPLLDAPALSRKELHEIREQLAETLTRDAGIIRTPEGLARAASNIAGLEVRGGGRAAAEVRLALRYASELIAAMRARTNTLGPHFIDAARSPRTTPRS